MTTVFLHGLGQTPDSWEAVLRRLPPERGGCCPALPALLEGEASFEALFQGLCRFCGELEGPLHLCGLSLGGVLALRFAAEHPERTASLVLIGTPAAVPKRLLRVQNALFRLLPARAFEGFGFGRRDVLALCRSMAALDLERWSRGAVCPALAVCGERDRVNRRSAEVLARRLPRGRLRILPGAGHEGNRDAPEALAELLTEFYRRLAAPGGWPGAEK